MADRRAPGACRRRRYIFTGRDQYGNYTWESYLPIPGDSRHEYITVNPTWFWVRKNG